MALCMWPAAIAEDTPSVRNHNIYLELYGASGLLGINYDSRFTPESPFGYRVGIGYFNTTAPFMQLKFDSRYYYVGLPLEVNYLLGKHKSKFEVGLGASLGVMHSEYLSPSGKKKSDMFGYNCFVNVGYRYQRPSGFMLRAGFSPSFTFDKLHGVGRGMYSVLPYVSVGNTFLTRG